MEVVEHHSEGGWDGEGHGDGGALLLAVGMQRGSSPGLEMGGAEWEDFCRECGVGWEWIDGEIVEGWEGGKEQRNEFGGEYLIPVMLWFLSPSCFCRRCYWWSLRADFSCVCVGGGVEKVGIARLKEALEAHEWDAGGGDVDVDELEEELGAEDGFGAEAAEVEREIVGLKIAVRRERGEDGEEEEEENGADEGVEELENMMLKMQAIKDMGADMPEGERRKFAARAVRDVMKTM